MGLVGRGSDPNLLESSGIGGDEVLAFIPGIHTGSPSDRTATGLAPVPAAAADVDFRVVAAEVSRVKGFESGAVLAARVGDLG